MIQIYVDSAANIPAVLVEKYKINVLTFINLVDGKEVPGFIAGISPEEERAAGKAYYDSIRNGASVKTSLINSAAFEEYFEEPLKNGDDIIYISLSSNISGTYNAARNAIDDLLETYPDRKIKLIDSMNASLGQGILALYARELIEKGLDIDKIASILSDTVPHMNGTFTVEDLKYLAHTGRIHNYVALAGNILNIKPILYGNKEGYIVQGKKIRGRQKSINELIKIICENIIEPEKQIIGIAHADAYEESLEIMKAVQEKVKVRDFINTSYDFCTGSHVGPGTLAVFFIGYDREMKGCPEGFKMPELFQYI